MLETDTPEKLGLCSKRLGRLGNWLDQQVGSGRLAGASALVGRHGKIAFFQSAGLAERETD